MTKPKSADWPRRVVAGSVTVKIYRTSKSKVASGYEFTVTWRTAHGRKRRGFTDEKQAMAEARRVALDLSNGRTGAAAMSNADYEELLAARELASGLPLLSAMQEWARAREISRGDVLGAIEFWAQRNGLKSRSITISQAIDAYLRARRADGIKTELGAERTLNSSRASNNFRDRFGARLLAEVTTNELAQWLQGYEDPMTRNTHRKRVVALFRWARKRGYLPLDTMTAAERTDNAQERESAVEIITAATLRELFTLIAAEHPHYIPALALAAFCGMRSAEIHGQAWEDFDWKRLFLRVSIAKPRTPARRQVPLNETARAWLSPHRQPTGPLCPNLCLHRIRDIGRTHGLALPKNCFRHTFISAQVELTGDIPRTALESGTSPRQIHAHYRQLLTREEAQAWFAVLPESE